MKCPDCGHDIAAATVHGETANACVECGGIWVETGELRPFFERILARSPDLYRDEAVPSNFPPVGTFYKTGLNCPACGQQMEKTYYAYDSGILVEHCIPCGGTWIEASRIGQLAACIRENARPLTYSDVETGDENYEETLPAGDRPPLLNQTLALIFVGVCYVVLIFACYNLYHVGFAIQRGRASLEWLQTQGTYEEMASYVTSTGFGRSRSKVYVIKYRYTYDFNGIRYVGDATWPNGDGRMVRSKREMLLGRKAFTPGFKTTVYVDPDNPRHASVRKGISPFREEDDLPKFIILAIVASLGLLLTARSLVIRYRST